MSKKVKAMLKKMKLMGGADGDMEVEGEEGKMDVEGGRHRRRHTRRHRRSRRRHAGMFA
jgi:hypothetical protein